jgi:sortase (surface protein transpeptidase)
MKLRFTFTLGLLFIAAGLLFAYGPYKQSTVAHNIVAAPTAVIKAVKAPSGPNVIVGHPTRLDIPSLKISLSIINGYYDSAKQTWTLTNDAAQYATITPEPNSAGGNTFMYGHDINRIFGRLAQIQVGQQAIIYTDNGHIFSYTFTGARETNPYDDSLFGYKGAPILTLQTCSGIFSQNRELFTFTFTAVV